MSLGDGPDLLGMLGSGRDPAAVPAPGGPASEEPICSRRGCTRPGRYALEWNNPKIHTPERRKIWLACAEHREYLADFLDARGFLRRQRPL